MDAALYVLLSVTQYTDLHVYRSSHVRGQFCFEAKIQVFSVLSWKPALEMPLYVKIQIFLFLKARSWKKSY